MGTLYSYELKKLLCQKVLWIASMIFIAIGINVLYIDRMCSNAFAKKDYYDTNTVLIFLLFLMKGILAAKGRVLDI